VPSLCRPPAAWKLCDRNAEQRLPKNYDWGSTNPPRAAATKHRGTHTSVLTGPKPTGYQAISFALRSLETAACSDFTALLHRSTTSARVMACSFAPVTSNFGILPSS
jgi:hypothetical protein